MSRLIDRLLCSKLQVPPFTPPRERHEMGQVLREMTPALLAPLRRAEVLVVDNVVDYFYSGTTQEWWEWDRDFPCLAPPFETFWVETLAPRHAVSEACGTMTPPSRLCHAWGAIVEGIEWASLRRDRADTYLRSLPRLPQQPRWLLSFDLFVEPRKHDVFLFGKLLLLLDANGRVIHAEGGESGSTVVEYIPVDDWDLRAGLRKLLPPMLMPFALAISFLHCRNVQLVERRPSPELSRAHKRRRGLPFVRYHVLEIEPMKRVLRTEGKADEVGLRQALHICRGHFKDYRQRGLFGKHRAIFWWESYLRGAPGFGVVDKDYNVLPAMTATGGAA
jgi:hypothetical protein